MSKTKLRTIFVLIASFAVDSQARSAEYAVTLLHPIGYDASIALAAANGAQSGYVRGSTTADQERATLWHGSAASAISLHPPGAGASRINGADENTQVGTAGPGAALWHGTAESYVNLHPTGWSASFAEAAAGDSQVGLAFPEPFSLGIAHAMLWHGTAESFIDLHPAGFQQTFGLGATETQQVGRGFGTLTGNHYHALLWSGSAESVVDLHPDGYDLSAAIDAWGSYQAGYVTSADPTTTYAALWNGTAESMVLLHPPGFHDSIVRGISSAGQVGSASNVINEGDSHALYWNGSIASVVDLHAFLSQLGTSFSRSNAFSIADNGTIVGSAATANGYFYAVKWTPIPEPSTFVLLSIAFSLMSHSRLRRNATL